MTLEKVYDVCIEPESSLEANNFLAFVPFFFILSIRDKRNVTRASEKRIVVSSFMILPLPLEQGASV